LVTNGGARFGIAVEDADTRAFFQKAGGGGCADSAGASGDEDSSFSLSFSPRIRGIAEFYQGPVAS
jgi:hypothetical protein